MSMSRFRSTSTWLMAFAMLAGMSARTSAVESERTTASCIPAITYLPLDAGVVGQDAHGKPVLGTYERISPDGRFILRSYSGAMLGRVALMELPLRDIDPVKAFRTPFSNEAFPVQGTWRYLVDVNGEHYRFADVLRLQERAQPLFRGGMTGFYAAASELGEPGGTDLTVGGRAAIHIRSLSWPQNADPDQQGVGPLQLATLEIADDGQHARVVRTEGPRFICAGRVSIDGNVYALPMISIDGREFSAIPQSPREGKPSMRVYGLDGRPDAQQHPCDLKADLGFSPGKAVFGFPPAGGAAWLTYSDLGHVYVYDRSAQQTYRLDHARYRVLASAFPGLTRDGRVIYGATWHDCPDASACPERAGYVVVDPYQSAAYKAAWQRRGQEPPKACITVQDVERERSRFAWMHGLGR